MPGAELRARFLSRSCAVQILDLIGIARLGVPGFHLSWTHMSGCCRRVSEPRLIETIEKLGSKIQAVESAGFRALESNRRGSPRPISYAFLGLVTAGPRPRLPIPRPKPQPNGRIPDRRGVLNQAPFPKECFTRRRMHFIFAVDVLLFERLESRAQSNA